MVFGCCLVPSVQILDMKKTLVFNVYITFWQDMLLAVLAFGSEIETDECWSSPVYVKNIREGVKNFLPFL